MIRRLRLIDAVAVAAGAMLVLKVLGFASGSRASDADKIRLGPRPGPESSMPFAGALVRARTNPDPEVSMTGTVVRPNGPEGGAARPDAGAPQVPVPAPRADALSEALPTQASSAERALLERLGERREQWQQKGRDLDLRERLLEDAERKLEARINDLKALEQKLGAATAKRGEPENGSLKNLVTMYETMKPKEAARVFDRLSHEVLVPVVLQMNPRKMAEILAVMSPEAAERLTVALASRAKGQGTGIAAAPGGATLPPNELPAIDPGAPHP